MRKIYSFMVGAVAMFAAVSCAQELKQDNQLPEGEVVVFEATVDGADTKAHLEVEGEGDDRRTFSIWDATDKITIHNGTTGYEFATSPDDVAEDGLSARFSYVGNEFSGEKFMAVYPAGTYTADVEAKTVNAYIPTIQGAVIGTYAKKTQTDIDATLAVAYTEDNSLAFKNACALIKFTVEEANIKAIEFYGNNGEAITGNMLVSLGNDNKIASVEGQMTTFIQDQWNEQTQKMEQVSEEKLGTWVECYAQESNWCFTPGETYYAAIAPANFTKGVSVNLFYDDGNGGKEKVEKAMTTNNPKNLVANTILNLGTLKHIKPGTGTSGWSLPGGHNDWNTEDTFLSEEGDYYVAKNVSGLNSGFKFHHAEFGWKGVGSTDAVATGAWHKLNGDKNISLVDAEAYDIYMTKDGSQFQAVAAGSAIPEAPVVVADYWGLIGSMASSNWATDLKLTEEGEYLVVKGVELTTTDEFKFRKNGEWNEQKIASATAKANIEYDFVDAGSNNMKVAVAGTYDVYVKKDLTKVYFMTIGKTPAEAVTATTYKFYIKPSVTWNKYYLYAWGGYSTGNWPGKQLTNKETAPDSKGECYFVEIPNGTNIVNFIVNNNSGKQTKDLTTAKIKQLTTGDYYYELVSGDIK